MGDFADDLAAAGDPAAQAHVRRQRRQGVPAESTDQHQGMRFENMSRESAIDAATRWHRLYEQKAAALASTGERLREANAIARELTRQVDELMAHRDSLLAALSELVEAVDTVAESRGRSFPAWSDLREATIKARSILDSGERE